MSPLPRAVAVLALLVMVLTAPSMTPMVSTVRADTGLSGAIASVYFPRYEDASLHAIAHERVAELAACECLEHDKMRPSTAEVIAFNSGVADPVSRVVSQWQASPPHDAILANRTYGRIGCAELVDGATHWFACVLTWGDLPPAPVAPAPPPQGGSLPDTALPRGE